MSSTSSVREPQPSHLEIPSEPGRSWRSWVLAGLVVVLAACGWAYKAGLINPQRLWTRPPATLTTVPVDQATMYVVVTENGSLESSNNTTIRCQVEALMGLVGGATAQQGGAMGGRPGGVAAGGGRPGGVGQPGQQGQQPQQQQPTASKKKAQGGAGAAGKAGGGGAGSALVTGVQPGAANANPGAGATASSGGGGGGMGGGGGGAGGGGGGGGGGAGGGGGGAGGGGAATTAVQVAVRPVIRSFAYMVPPYMPLRPKVPGAQPAQVKKQADPNMMGGGGGGGGRGGGGGGGGRRGGGGGGGGDGMGQEKAGSTRIISIAAEGTRVKAGELVCEFDASAFRDEVQAQTIRKAQAKALVEQAQAILDVSKITLQEYENGIYPQDVQLVTQYLKTCEIDAERARKNLVWSRDTHAKGFRATNQLKADIAAVEQTQIAHREATGMLNRLTKYTGPRLIKHLKAKIKAIESDKLAQESVYQLESDRLRRLELMVSNCTLRAPRDGIVVYANPANRMGQVEPAIQEGATVRQGQAIINLPDPNHMQVRAQINESKVSSIHAGQKARVRIDAFPDRPMMGTVEGVTPIPAPTGRSGQDVRVYFATVELDTGGFDDLRPGLSAEVTFLVEEPRQVTRVPLQAVRWVNEIPFVAVSLQGEAGGKSKKPSNDGSLPWQWRRLKVGQSDTSHLEVLSGLEPGDRVVARPDLLPAPVVARMATFVEAKPAAGPKG